MTNRQGYKIVSASRKSFHNGTAWDIGVEQRLPLGTEPVLCATGFHYCPLARDCLRYFTFTNGNRLLRVRVPDGATVVTGPHKCCASALVAVEDVTAQASLLLAERPRSVLKRSVGRVGEHETCEVVRGPDGYRRKAWHTDASDRFIRQDGLEAPIVVNASFTLAPGTTDWNDALALLNRIEPFE
jgi:hypothetical protein